MGKASQLFGVERMQAAHNDDIGRVDFFWSGKSSRFMIAALCPGLRISITENNLRKP
jgi:hypothetical protein